MNEIHPTIERANIFIVEPPTLAAIRDRVRATIPQAETKVDRRGFQLLQWPTIRPNMSGKPIELSLEHEVRLRAERPCGSDALLRRLDAAEGRELFPGHPIVGDLIVRRVKRAPGAQSIDRYWDVANDGFAANMASLRQRIKTSKFMTWSGDENAEALAVFNLELPIVALGQAGVVARLEFNWIDDLASTFSEFRDRQAGAPTDRRNPLVLSFEFLSSPLEGELRMVVEHTTFREKYSLRRRETDGDESERFQLNIDHMVAQSLDSGHFGYHCDVDVAAAVSVDMALLHELDALASALSENFELRPADAPKFFWDLKLVKG